MNFLYLIFCYIQLSLATHFVTISGKLLCEGQPFQLGNVDLNEPDPTIVHKMLQIANPNKNGDIRLNFKRSTKIISPRMTINHRCTFSNETTCFNTFDRILPNSATKPSGTDFNTVYNFGKLELSNDFDGEYMKRWRGTTPPLRNTPQPWRGSTPHVNFNLKVISAVRR